MVRQRGLVLLFDGLYLRKNTEIYSPVLVECEKKGGRGYYMITGFRTYPLSTPVTRQLDCCAKQGRTAA